jgi:putative SbcD/Mre11-related phosphoesterase
MQLTDWLLTPCRVAIHLPTATAVIADLHLGYGEARQRGGEAVPARSLAEQLAPLATAARRYGFRRLVIAGDLFEDGRCAGQLAPALNDWLEQAQVELTAVVPGNHDRGLSGVAWPLYRDGIALGDWCVVHGDGVVPAGPVVHGHVHPCLRWGGVTAPCYLLDDQHLVLPAYSEDAAGVNVLREWHGSKQRCYVIVGEQVLDFGTLAALRRRCRA